MDFEWDPEKAASNFDAHGVTFDEAATAFADPLAITKHDPDHSEDENRFILVGHTTQGSLVVVIHVDRDGTTRLISARVATARERRVYEDGEAD